MKKEDLNKAEMKVYRQLKIENIKSRDAVDGYFDNGKRGLNIMLMQAWTLAFFFFAAAAFIAFMLKEIPYASFSIGFAIVAIATYLRRSDLKRAERVLEVLKAELPE